MEMEGQVPDPVEHACVLLADVCKGDIRQAVEIAKFNADYNPGPTGAYWATVHQALKNLQVDAA